MHFMIAEKSSDVKVKRVSRLAESKSRCCISHDFGGFYQIIPCIRPAVVRIKVAHGCPATIRIFILGRAVQAWQREPGGRPMPHARNNVGCDACHGGDPASADAFRAHRSILNSRNPVGPVHRGNIVRTCGTCHTGPYVAFQGSRHFELLKEDDQRPPVCTTCHSEDGVGGNPQFPAQARGLLESIREVRTLLDEAQPLIRRVADADRRQELEEQYQQAEVPVIEAVQFGHSFNFERVEERRETDRRRADALLEVLANPQ